MFKTNAEWRVAVLNILWSIICYRPWKSVWNNNNVIFQRPHKKSGENYRKVPFKRQKTCVILIVPSGSNSLHIPYASPPPPSPPPFWNEKGTGAEMGPAFVSGIVTSDVSVSYWPIFFPFSRKLFGRVSSLLKWQMTLQIWNFVSSFILILWDRFSRVQSWRQRERKDTDFKLTTSFIEFQLYILCNIWWCITLEALIESSMSNYL